MKFNNTVHTLKKISLILIVLCNSNCSSIWPKYAQPNVNPELKWHSADPKTEITHLKFSEMAWWKHFNDPQLNNLIKTALLKNNDLHVAYGNILLAKAELQQVRYQWLPNFGGAGNGVSGILNNFNFNNRDGHSIANKYTRDDWVYNGYTAGFTSDYNLNLLSQIKKIELGKLALAYRIELAHVTRLTIISQISASYFTLLASTKQLAIHRKMLSDLTRLRHYNLIKQKNGNVSDMQVAMIEQHIALVQKEIPMIQHNITAAENSIHSLINGNPGSVKLTKRFDEINANGIIPMYVPADAVKNRPDILAAEYELKMSYASIARAKSAFFPTIDLAGYLGPLQLQVNKGFHLYTDFLMGQLGVVQPIFAFGSLYSDIKKAHATKYAAYYNYLSTVRNAFKQIDDSISRHHRTNQSYEQQLIAFRKAQKQYRLGMLQYHEGAIAYSDTLPIEFNRDLNEALLNQQKQAPLLSIVELYSQLGGGAKVEDKEEPAQQDNMTQNKKNRVEKLLFDLNLW